MMSRRCPPPHMPTGRAYEETAIFRFRRALARRERSCPTWFVKSRASLLRSRRFSVTGVADVGGFGVGSDTSWEAIATLNYRLRVWLWLRAGYRHLEVDYEDGGFVHDVQMSGPMMGAGLQFQARRRRPFSGRP
jgi:hypothetical protein